MNRCWLTWNNEQVFALDGDSAGLVWRSALVDLPLPDIVTASGMRNTEVAVDTVAGVDPNANDDQQFFINRRGQRVFVGGGRRNAWRNGNAAPAAVAEPEVPINGAEQIWRVQPLAERVIVGTSTGRLLCLDLGTGKPLWQTRVSTKAIDRLIASEDFTAVKVVEEGATRLFVLDNYNGRIHMIRHFGDPNSTPVNMALSPDGMLVWTLPDRLCGKDLYEPEPNRLTFEEPQKQAGGNVNLTYLDCKNPGQLQIRGKQILAVRDRGRFISVHSLENGAIIQYPSGGSMAMQLLSNTAQGSASSGVDTTTSMRIVGPNLYVVTQRNMVAYNLDEPNKDTWKANVGDPILFDIRAAVPTKRLMMMIAGVSSRKPNDNPARIYRLRFYPLKEATDVPHPAGGLIVHEQTVSDLAGISAWQGVEGGVYYLSEDHRLHFLRGSVE